MLPVAVVVFLSNCNSAKLSAGRNTDKLTDSLTQALTQFSQKTLIPGFSVAIVNHNGVVYTKGFGFANLNNNTPFTPATINWVASVSKTFVALSVMKLVEQGKLNLDEPVNNILPYKITNPYFPKAVITVRHLVTHTATIIDDAFVPYYIGEADICMVNDSKSYDSLPAYLQPNIRYFRMGKKISLDEHIRKYTQPGEKWYTDSTFLKVEPGSHFQYSNLGAAIAARIVEIRSGMPFTGFTQQYIFNPLGMNNTGWNFEDLNPALVSRIYAHNDEQKPTGVVEHPQYYMTNFPVSGLKTNAADLGAYLVEMIRGFNGKGKLLGKEAYHVLFQPQLTCGNRNTADSSNFNGHYNMGVFWSVSATGYRLHFGGNTGVYSFVYFNPKTGSGALAFCNLRDNDFGEILRIVHDFEQKMHR